MEEFALIPSVSTPRQTPSISNCGACIEIAHDQHLVAIAHYISEEDDEAHSALSRAPANIVIKRTAGTPAIIAST